MRNTLIILFTGLALNVSGQDEVKNRIAELWWNNEIEITNNRNQKLNSDDAIYVIRNQNVSTNCWSKFYRYTQNIQQSSGEQIIFHKMKGCQIIKGDSIGFKVVESIKRDTGEEIRPLFTYKFINKNINRSEWNNLLDKFVNEELKISRIIIRDSLNQFIDECHKKYSIELKLDGTFMQSYENQTDCNCEITANEFEQIHHIGFAKFNEANHTLLGLSGDWKIESDKLYLKFSSGNIFKYEVEIKESKLLLKESLTTIELEKTNR